MSATRGRSTVLWCHVQQYVTLVNKPLVRPLLFYRMDHEHIQREKE